MGKKRKATVETPEEVNCDDEEVNENLRASSSSNQNSLYEILRVDKAASQQEIKKAYYKLALRLHPDKNPDDEEAKEKFQQLQKVISIIGDEEKRAVYDQTGCVDDADLVRDAIQSLQTFFRSMYKKISEADIEEFEANYRGSYSEKHDLLKLFKECKGNMDRSKESSVDLYAIIAQRQNERRSKIDTMFSNLVHKYGGVDAVPEPSEEEFEAARRKLNNQKKSKQK
ncbi:chaperone protein dnaJ 6 [Dorcoceras hygrometricum]|uniref:Chaperone protein dnaJ 6 n=1 Tax=Dorcoceras hygrometricum TaxID=472368 RepID=A0A2Z7CT79_9LAMI|nr:chaperone protein dnaJ 6 [Dorcoceras hygrometricum]